MLWPSTRRPNLGAPDTYGWSNVYVRNVTGAQATWSTTWVSRTWAGAAPNSRFNIWVDYEDPQLAGIPARSRFNVPVGAFFPQAAGKRFGAVVESQGTTPALIVVERAMYWDAPGQPWAAGTNALATKLQ